MKKRLASWDKYYVSNDEALAMVKNWKNSTGKQKAKIQGNIVSKLSYMVCARIKKYRDKNYYDDLKQEGTIGLLIACEKFDISRGQNFFSYGTWHIQNKLRLYLRKHYKNNVETPSGHTSSIFDSEVLDMSEEYEKLEAKKVLVDAINKLPDVDKRVVLMRFGIDGSGGATYQQIGDEFKVSRQRIEQIAMRAIKKLRTNESIREFFCEL